MAKENCNTCNLQSRCDLLICLKDDSIPVKFEPFPAVELALR